MRILSTMLISTAISLGTMAQTIVRLEKIDEATIDRIKTEGMSNSKVMNHAFYLTDVAGPRLTNSPGYKRAAEWAVKQLKAWGIDNAHLEAWGEFGKSWNLEKSYVAMTAPYYRPLIAFPKTWTRGTNGMKSVELLMIDPADSGKLESLRAKMKGRMVIFGRDDVYKQSFKADAARYTDEELAKMAAFTPRPTDTAAQRQQREAFMRNMGGTQGFMNKVRAMAEQEGALGMFSVNPRGHDGTIFVQGSTRNAQHKDSADAMTDIVLSTEDYMSLCRLSKAGVPVKLDVEVQVTSSKAEVTSYNVVAEIPGTDPKLKDEIVMLGAHLDSWQGSTGATDNAAGSASMMEAIRIIKQLGIKPRRTIRIALWSGEEQGLLGSRAYVKNTFGDAKTPLAPHEKFSCYFNIDNGTGKVRGIYAQGSEEAAAIFKEWLVPFKDLGAATVTLNNTGSTDHISFQNAGLPGFQFIQDPIEYSTRTHHTTMDSYDHLIEEDLKQISTIVAAFVYNAAMRDDKMPRKK